MEILLDHQFWFCILLVLSGIVAAHYFIVHVLPKRCVWLLILRYALGTAAIGVPFSIYGALSEWPVAVHLTFWFLAIAAGGMTIAVYLVDEAILSKSRGKDLETNGYGDHQD